MDPHAVQLEPLEESSSLEMHHNVISESLLLWLTEADQIKFSKRRDLYVGLSYKDRVTDLYDGARDAVALSYCNCTLSKQLQRLASQAAEVRQALKVATCVFQPEYNWNHREGGHLKVSRVSLLENNMMVHFTLSTMAQTMSNIYRAAAGNSVTTISGGSRWILKGPIETPNGMRWALEHKDSDIWDPPEEKEDRLTNDMLEYFIGQGSPDGMKYDPITKTLDASRGSSWSFVSKIDAGFNP